MLNSTYTLGRLTGFFGFGFVFVKIHQPISIYQELTVQHGARTQWKPDHDPPKTPVPHLATSCSKHTYGEHLSTY